MLSTFQIITQIFILLILLNINMAIDPRTNTNSDKGGMEEVFTEEDKLWVGILFHFAPGMD